VIDLGKTGKTTDVQAVKIEAGQTGTEKEGEEEGKK
jgi:hypothetical protein